MSRKRRSPVVSIVMGSDSDYSVMKEAAAALEKFAVPCRMRVLSAHRAPRDLVRMAESARNEGVRVFIAGAGGAAHLPGMIAALTELPVIGVPIPHGALKGQDALLSIVQMPKGVPVATVAIGNAWNAGLLAVQILAAGGTEAAEKLLGRLAVFKKEMRRNVLSKKLPGRKKMTAIGGYCS